MKVYCQSFILPTDPHRSVQHVLTRAFLSLNVCANAFARSSFSSQIQMYQLSRLLHDYHRELYNHLEDHEISPSLYAAPWFLTLFASQFPLGFVSRIFGTNTFFLNRHIHVVQTILFSNESEIFTVVLLLFQISYSSKGQE